MRQFLIIAYVGTANIHQYAILKVLLRYIPMLQVFYESHWTSKQMIDLLILGGFLSFISAQSDYIGIVWIVTLLFCWLFNGI